MSGTDTGAGADAIKTAVVQGSPSGIAQAAELIAHGEVVAFPTETVYGLGADAANADAVARIFAAKDRPRFNPLIVHVASIDAVRRLGRLPAIAEDLVARHWPGPLTLVLQRQADCPVANLATAGLDTIALRIPSDPTATTLLEVTGRPIAAPSANRSGEVSPTDARHVVASLGGRIPLVLAGGRSRVGLESTVLDVSADTPVLLRPGAVTRAEIEALIGPISVEATDDGGRPRSPGLMLRHYAPAARLRLDAADATAGEALLAFGPTQFLGKHALAVANLSESGDLTEAAANLFGHLRALDRPEHQAIAVMPIPEEGLGAAINDRLRRAAS